MKAFDYKNRFVESIGDFSNLNVTSATKAIAEIGKTLLQETADLINVRHVKDEIAVYAVLFEQDLKWKSFAKLVNQHYNSRVIKPEGFRIILESSMKDTYDSWMIYEKMQKVAQNLRKPTIKSV